MSYTVNPGEKGKVEIKITVPQAEFAKVYNQVLVTLAKDLKVSGFRPGHVPSQIAEEKIGLGKILNETAIFFISQELSKVLQKEKIIPLGNPNIAIDSLSKDKDFIFSAVISQKPKVSIGDWKTIKVRKIAARKVTDKEVTESIKNIFEAWEKEKGKEKEGKRDEETERMSDREEGQPSFAEASEGQGKFIYDAHGNRIYLNEEKEEVKGLRDQAGTPRRQGFAGQEIDDQFAREIGAKDLTHLREIVKGDLETIVTDQIEAKFEEEIFEKIVGSNPIDIPEALIGGELNRMLTRLELQLERQEKKLEDYLAEQKLSSEELKNKWRSQAEKNVKISLVVEEIGRLEKVQVTQEELATALKGVNHENFSIEQKADLERYLVASLFQAKTLALVKKTVAKT